MITLHDHCRLGRRDFLRIGTLGLGGLSLAGLPTFATPLSLENEAKAVRDCSVIFLYLHGGPSQVETFDPKMTAPEGTRSATGEVKTSIPGVTFGGSFPKLAKLARKVSVVRSYVSGDGNHDIKPVVGKATFSGNLGSAYSRIAGANHPTTGMPSNAVLFPRAVDSRAQPGQMGFGKFDSTGPFGAATAPFVPGTGGDLQRDMTLRLPRERLDDRRSLLKAFDGLKASLDGGEIEASREKAFEVILRGVGDAFDLAKEDPRTVARYDTEPLIKPDSISKKWNNHKNYLDNARSLGKLLLLARRLCERGCGFVTVTTNFVWDMHADVNNATMTEGMGYMGLPLDHALSAFLDDVHARGLEKKILLVVTGEMGRTPRINAKGGRDHWGNIAPLLLAGGPLRMGQVVGQSNKIAGEPATEPVRIPNLVGTILHSLFDIGKLRITRGVPRELLTMAEYQPIEVLH
jgi:hypothetical protein